MTSIKFNKYLAVFNIGLWTSLILSDLGELQVREPYIFDGWRALSVGLALLTLILSGYWLGKEEKI